MGTVHARHVRVIIMKSAFRFFHQVFVQVHGNHMHIEPPDSISAQPLLQNSD
jgi:hypothetical protein